MIGAGAHPLDPRRAVRSPGPRARDRRAGLDRGQPVGVAQTADRGPGLGRRARLDYVRREERPAHLERQLPEPGLTEQAAVDPRRPETQIRPGEQEAGPQQTQERQVRRLRPRILLLVLGAVEVEHPGQPVDVAGGLRGTVRAEVRDAVEGRGVGHEHAAGPDDAEGSRLAGEAVEQRHGRIGPSRRDHRVVAAEGVEKLDEGGDGHQAAHRQRPAPGRQPEQRQSGGPGGDQRVPAQLCEDRRRQRGESAAGAPERRHSLMASQDPERGQDRGPGCHGETPPGI